MKTFTLALLGVALVACGDDDTSSTPAPTSTTTPDAGTSTSATAVNGCTEADFDAPANANGGDNTSQASVTINFPATSTPAQYTNHCLKVKSGATVNIVGDFGDHPLAPSGGDANSPIKGKVLGTTTNLTMSTTGTFGYHCAAHPTIMFGAIRVVR